MNDAFRYGVGTDLRTRQEGNALVCLYPVNAIHRSGNEFGENMPY